MPNLHLKSTRTTAIKNTRIKVPDKVKTRFPASLSSAHLGGMAETVVVVVVLPPAAPIVRHHGVLCCWTNIQCGADPSLLSFIYLNVFMFMAKGKSLSLAPRDAVPVVLYS